MKCALHSGPAATCSISFSPTSPNILYSFLVLLPLLRLFLYGIRTARFLPDIDRRPKPLDEWDIKKEKNFKGTSYQKENS